MISWFETMFGRRPPDSPGRDDLGLPWVVVRGIPRAVVVGDDPTVRGDHIGVTEFRRQLARRCSHRDGWACGVCADSEAVAAAVSRCGRVRVLPGV